MIKKLIKLMEVTLKRYIYKNYVCGLCKHKLFNLTLSLMTYLI